MSFLGIVSVIIGTFLFLLGLHGLILSIRAQNIEGAARPTIMMLVALVLFVLTLLRII